MGEEEKRWGWDFYSALAQGREAQEHKKSSTQECGEKIFAMRARNQVRLCGEINQRYIEYWLLHFNPICGVEWAKIKIYFVALTAIHGYVGPSTPLELSKF